jgi:hypothetical protein
VTEIKSTDLRGKQEEAGTERGGKMKGDTTDSPATTREGRRRRRRGFWKEGNPVCVVALTDPLRKAKIPGFAAVPPPGGGVGSCRLSLGYGMEWTESQSQPRRQAALSGRGSGDPLSVAGAVTPTRTNESVAGLTQR